MTELEATPQDNVATEEKTPTTQNNLDALRQQMSGEKPQESPKPTIEVVEEKVVVENTATEETPHPPATPSISDDDVLNYFKQQDKFKDIESIEDVYKQQEVAVEPQQQQYDAETQSYLDFHKDTNKGVNEYMKLKSLDVENMSDKEFAIYSLKAQTPTLSDSDAEFLYNNKYNKDADIEDEATVRMASIDLQTEVLKGKALVDSDINSINTPQENPQTQMQEEVAKANEAWNVGMDSAIDTYNKPSQMKLDDELTVEYSFNDKQKEIMGAFKDMNTVGKYFADEKGQFDYGRFTNLIADGLSANDKIEMAYKQGLEKGKLNNIQQHNGGNTPKGQEAPPSSNGSNAERLFAQLKAKGIRT